MANTQAPLSLMPFYPAVILFIFSAPVAFVVLYRLYLYPLSHIPGPPLARITSFYLYAICYLGIECRQIQYYHHKYKTSVLRIAPNAVSISDGAALRPIYVAGGGFEKTARYENFKVGGVDTIFSSRDSAYRDARAKAVSPLFAMGRVRAAGVDAGIIRKVSIQFVEHLAREKANAPISASGTVKVDILDLAYRSLIDSVTGYLFGQTYGALDETRSRSINPLAGTSRMSALPFIFAIVEAGRFSLLPNWLFRSLDHIISMLVPDHAFSQSFECVWAFADHITFNTNCGKGADTYQSRLLAAGISKRETILQCMAVMFAGTDSTAVKLVTIIFHLIQNPRVIQNLEDELQALGKDPATDPQTFPYLRAVIKEGLRLGMANPARFSRKVPPEGFHVGETFISGGTDVGLAPYVLHHNAELFLEPYTFRPERWLDGVDKSRHVSDARKKEMDRDVIPFGVGLRACIAKNFATHQLFVATKVLIESGALRGARTCTDTIELVEYFNVEIRHHRLEIEWPR